MTYCIVTNDYYFLVGASSIFKTLGLSFTSKLIPSPDVDVCIMQHVGVAVCFFHHIALYQKQLVNISDSSDRVCLVVDGVTEKRDNFPIIASASSPVDTFIATVLGINSNRWHYPKLTLRMKMIIHSLYQNKPLGSISRNVGISEKSIYGIKRHLIKTMGLGNLNSAYGLIIAYCVVILQVRYSIRH